MEGASVRLNNHPPIFLDNDLESVYKSICEEYNSECTVVLQNTQKLESYGDLFYTRGIIGGQVEAMPCDDLILDSNLLKHLIHQLRNSEKLLECVSECDSSEQNKLLELLANVKKWKNGTVPDVVGIVKIQKGSITPTHD